MAARIYEIFETYDNLDGWPYALLAIPIAYPLALGLEVVVGIPMLLAGQRLGLIRWWTAATSGALVGVIGGTMLSLYGIVNHPAAFVEDVTFPAAVGALCGFTFWIFWRVRRAVQKLRH